MSKVKTTLSEVKQIFTKYEAKLNIISDDIREIELFLESSSVRIPFELNYETFMLSWDREFEEEKKFRLLYTDEKITKPLLETKVQIRMNVHPHLDKFIKEFANFIKGAE